MSDVTAIAQNFAASQADSVRQSLQAGFVKQQAQAEQGLVDILEQSADRSKALLPPGQGASVDRSA